MPARWLTFDRAAADVDGIARVLGVSLPVQKQDALDRTGFLDVVRRVTRALTDATASAEQRATGKALRELSQNWGTLTPEGRQQAVERIKLAIAETAAVASPAVARVLQEHGERIVRETKRAAIGRYDLPIRPSFSAVDERVIEHAASSQALFVTDEYRRRADGVGERARAIVAAGLEQGLDHFAIGRDLREEIGARLEGRSDAYWPVVGSIFAARSRTFGQLSGFSEAGIEQYTFDAVLDEKTSIVCRFMHGRTFSVAAGMQRYQDVADSEDPEAVRLLQPFLQMSRDEKGRESIYFKRGDQRVGVARVVDNAVGRKDDVGKFSRGMSTAKLESAGISMPPLHGLCRSTVIPSFGTSGGAGGEPTPRPFQVQVPPPPPLPPPPPPEPPKPVVGPVAVAPPPPPKPKPPPKTAEMTTHPPTPKPIPNLTQSPLVAAPRAVISGQNADGVPTLDVGGSPARLTSEQQAALRQLDRGIKAIRGRPSAEQLSAFDETIARLGRNGQDGAEVLRQRGEIVQLRIAGVGGEEEIANMTTRPMDRALLARFVAEPRPPNCAAGPAKDVASEDAARLPVLARSGGKVWVHEGAEILAARRLLGEGTITARFIDLDALAPPKKRVDPADWASRMQGAADAIANGTASKEQQATLRAGLREVLADHGIVTRDDRRRDKGFAFSARPNPTMNACLLSTSLTDGTDAVHDWDGETRIRPDGMQQAARGLRALARGVELPKLGPFGDRPLAAAHEIGTPALAERVAAMRNLERLGTMIHEELHGASAAAATAYQAQGAGIEEAATEILARRVLRQLCGSAPIAQNPNVVNGIPFYRADGKLVQPDGRKTYYGQIHTLVTETAKFVPKAEAHSRVEDACLATRQPLPGVVWRTPADQVQAYVDALGLANPKDREALAKTLLASQGMLTR